MNIYWWIEKVSTGKLVVFGRRKSPKIIDSTTLYEFLQNRSSNLITADGIHESGCPNIQNLRRDAQELCRNGEIPIKVKLIKY